MGGRAKYSLADSYVSARFCAVVARNKSGSELFFWDRAGKLRVKVKSRFDLFSPFVSDNGMALFIERTHAERITFRLLGIDLSSDRPELIVLFVSNRFLGFPSQFSGRVFVISGDYDPAAMGNPVPRRTVAVLVSGGLLELANATFSTLGRLCDLGGERFLGVSVGVQGGNVPTREAESFGLMLDIDFDSNSLEVEPFLFDSPLSGTLLGLDCWGGKIAAKLVEFPVNGGRITRIAICSAEDGAVLKLFDLPSGSDFGLPHWVPDTSGGALVAFMTIPQVGSPSVWIVNTDGEVLEQVELKHEQAALELDTGAE